MAEHGSHLDRTLTEHVLYPPHPPRKPSKLYLDNHHQMVVIEDMPCRICGVRNSTLNDKEANPYGATALETHHALCEWALANAVDLSKFNRKVVPGLLRQTGDHETYGHAFTQKEMVDWIAGARGNLVVYCSVHHRGKYVGIHSITSPIFSIQDLLMDGYNLTGVEPATPQEAAQLIDLPLTTGKPKAAPEEEKVKPAPPADPET